LGLHCNTHTHICLYQLEFWGFIAIPTPIFAFTNWNFGASLQYLHPYLPLPTRILGLHCNTYTHTCLYQLEFWGFIAISTPILALPTGILGLHCNTCTCIYLYQLEFWGLIVILALVLTSTNWDFGA